MQGLGRPLHLQPIALPALGSEVAQQQPHFRGDWQQIDASRRGLDPVPQIGQGGANDLRPPAQRTQHDGGGEQADADHAANQSGRRIKPCLAGTLVDKAKVVQDDKVAPHRAGTHGKGADKQAAAGIEDRRQGIVLGARHTGAVDVRRPALGGMQELARVTAEAQGQQPFVLGDAVEKAHEIGAIAAGEPGRHLVADGVEDQP